MALPFASQAKNLEHWQGEWSIDPHHILEQICGVSQDGVLVYEGWLPIGFEIENAKD